MSKQAISKLTKEFITNFSHQDLNEPAEIEQVGNFDMGVVETEVIVDPPVTSRGERNIAKNCIILHGWNQSNGDMLRLEIAIRNLPRAAGYRFWNVSYDFRQPFPFAANNVIRALKPHGNIFSGSIIVAYSMGGVVARSMFTQGFQFGKLVTICSPHQGLAPWVPTPDAGSASLAPWSTLIWQLNNLPTDRNKRGDYYFFGTVRTEWNNKSKIIPDDGVVMIDSATGAQLPGIKQRSSIRLDYPGPHFPPHDAHSKGIDPRFVKPALDTINRLL